MKYTHILTITAISMVFNIATSSAAITNDVNDINIPSISDSNNLAVTDTNYQGRTDNTVKGTLGTSIDKKTNLTRTVTSKVNSSTRAQLENFETTMGELVQKIEDDRIKKSKKQEDDLESTKNALSSAYNDVNSIDESKLGSEQDPTVTNAFKCDDAENCIKNTDNNNIKDCSDDERLNWNGSKWRCIGIFDQGLSAGNCGTNQYKKSENGGYSCIDYIYMWKASGGYEACAYDNDLKLTVKKKRYKCYKKKTVSDKGNVVTGANALCYTLIADYVVCK